MFGLEKSYPVPGGAAITFTKMAGVPRRTPKERFVISTGHHLFGSNVEMHPQQRLIALEGLIQVFDEIIRVFQPHRKSEKTIACIFFP